MILYYMNQESKSGILFAVKGSLQQADLFRSIPRWTAHRAVPKDRINMSMVVKEQ